MLKRENICLEKNKLESKMNPMFLADEVGEMGCVEKEGKLLVDDFASLLWKSNKTKEIQFRKD